MNGYGRLSDLKADLAGVPGTTSLDDALLTLRDEVSREFDRETRRHFYTLSGTRYFSGEGCRELWLDDLISITTLKVADTSDQPATFENTLTAATDYTLWPRNAAAEGKPYRKIILNTGGQFGTFSRGVDNVELVGRFGYSEIWELTALTGTLTDASDTSLVASATAASIIDPGDMLKQEDEQVEVTTVVTTTLTVVRGRNGTSAVAHTAAPIYIRRYPADIENAVKERAVGRRWDAQGGYDGGITLTGDSGGAAGRTTGRAIYSRWRDICRAYDNPEAVM